MAVEHEEDSDDEPELANGDTLAERLAQLDLEEDDICSTDEMRERLGL
jgi:hypothetical protein